MAGFKRARLMTWLAISGRPDGEGTATSGGRNLVGSTCTSLAGAERMRDALNEYFGNMIDMVGWCRLTPG